MLTRRIQTIKASLQNLLYIAHHKYYVYLEGRKLQLPRKQLLLHDISKFSSKEFSAYRNHFFLPENESKANGEFELAWQHHLSKNPHHWQHWLKQVNGQTKPQEMPEKYAKEMLADWLAMSRKFNNSPKKWYYNRKENIILHPNTQQLVENFFAEKKY